MDEASIDSMNKEIVWKKSNVCIIRRKVRVSKMGQSISGAHGRAGDMDKLKVEILQEHQPTGLMMG